LVTSYRSAKISDNAFLQKDTPYILGAYVFVIALFGYWQGKVYQNERKKGELVHKK
jgi:hypothetical protein